MKLRRQFAGRVMVDHGGIAILDHQYTAFSDNDDDRIRDADPACDLDCEESEPVGVWSATGLGDGQYPVYVDVIETPETGKRVARIVIDCLGIESEPESAAVRAKLFDIAADLQMPMVTDAVAAIEANREDLPTTQEGG